MSSASSSSEERVLILAPLGRDGAIAGSALSKVGLGAEVCGSIEALCEGIDAGAGAVLLTEEALSQTATQLLLKACERQPPWSDLPLVVLTTSGHASGTNFRMLQTLGQYGNVTVLERPVRAITLVAAIRTALRARRRQYETRDYLAIRERVEAELRVARAAAERASQAKDNFLAMLGHELRNPLAAIVNGAAVLDRFEARSEAESRSRLIIGRQAQHLSRLIDDLLDVSRIMSGKITLRRDPVDLREVVRQCVESRHAAMSPTHQVSFETDAHPLVVEGDAVRLEQIVGNLLDNAVKYSPAGESVRVVARRENGEAVLRVEDRGVGLAAEMLESIFEPFTQSDVSLHRARGGLGLGLAVVKGLVEQHGGRVSAHSAGVGRGSEFVVRLPLTAEAAASPPASTPAPARHQRIVVVEDHDDARDALQILLTLQGHEVRTASDGLAGVALILEVRPDVALIDVGLPGLDGYEVARQVRQAEILPAVRLVAVTGYGQPYDRARAREAGFHLHLTKPVSPGDIGVALSGS
jgi:signal transduction histidine kinase